MKNSLLTTTPTTRPAIWRLAVVAPLLLKKVCLADQSVIYGYLGPTLSVQIIRPAKQMIRMPMAVPSIDHELTFLSLQIHENNNHHQLLTSALPFR